VYGTAPETILRCCRDFPNLERHVICSSLKIRDETERISPLGEARPFQFLSSTSDTRVERDRVTGLVNRMDRKNPIYDSRESILRGNR